MKRAFYEWGAVGSLALAIACFGYWGVSKITAAADSKISFGWRVLDASIANGTVTLADQLNNGEMIEIVENAIPFDPPLNPTDQYRLSLPGFEYHFIALSDDWPIWRIEFSLLIPALVFMLGAAYAIQKCRKIRRTTASDEKSPANSEPFVHPLD